MGQFSYTMIALFFIAQLGLARAVIHTERVELPAAQTAAADYRQAILKEAARWTDYSNENYNELKETSLAKLGPQIATQKYGLNSDEIFAINAYTNFMSTSVNHALNFDDKKDKAYFHPYTDLLRSALAKLPDYQGETERIANLPSDFLALHRVGKVVPYPAFTSSSIGGTYGKWSRNTRLIIQAKHGKHIEDFSADPEEREVIFAPNTQFKVKERSVIVGPNKQHVTLIHLEEI